MKYRLGLDLGVGSIGFALVEMDDAGKALQVRSAGVRIFTPSTGAAERRIYRGTRRHFQRKRKRLRHLWGLLAEHDFAKPIPKELQHKHAKESSTGKDTSRKRFFKKVLAKCPYQLRAESLKRQLELQELGFITYHMANHRGSSAIRSFGESETDKKESGIMKEKMRRAKGMMSDECPTFGAMVFYERQNAVKYHRKPVRASDLVPSRDMILDEFKKVYSFQKQFYPQILTDEYCQSLRECLDFEHEKLAPPPDRCPYNKEEERLPRAHPLSERRRIVEAINNVRYQSLFMHTGTGAESDISEWQGLSLDQRNALVKELVESGADLTETKALALLKLKKAPSPKKTLKNPEIKQFGRIKLQGKDAKTQKIKKSFLPSLTNALFWKKLDDQLQEDFVRDWNRIPDDRKLLALLVKKYGIPKEDVKSTMEQLDALPSGYAPIGRTATKILLNYLEAEPNLSFTEALEYAFDTGELLSFSMAEIQDCLPYYGEVLPESTQAVIAKPFHPKFLKMYGKNNEPETAPKEKEFGRIANPVVHQTLNELRKVVNCIIKKYGKPEEIGIELARDLHKSQEERDKIAREQNSNEKDRKKKIDEFSKNFGRPPTGKQLAMLRLLEDQQRFCVYCGGRLSPEDIANNELDIDHILPMSITTDNSYNNKVLSHRHCNLNKGNRAPYEAFAGDAEKWNIIQNILQNTPELARKKWRFEQGALDNYLSEKGFLDRYKTDTSYLAKTAKKYLGCLFASDEAQRKINPVQGGVTAQLRTAWCLNEVLETLVLEGVTDEKYRQTIEDEYSRGKKLRLDHRHHAVDAIAIALSTKGYQKLTNTLAGREMLEHNNKRAWYHKIFQVPFGLELGDFKEYVLKVLRSTPVSFRENHRVNGGLHKQTLYSVCGRSGNIYTCFSTKNVDSLKDEEQAQKRLLPRQKNKSFIEYDNIRTHLLANAKEWEAIQAAKPFSTALLEAENRELIAAGKKAKNIDNPRVVWTKTLGQIGGKKYYHFEKMESAKFHIIREPSATQSGAGYQKGSNYCVDLFHDNSGKLCGEIIRRIDAVRMKSDKSPFIPEYVQAGFKRIERLFIGDVLEIDYAEEVFPFANTGAPKGRVYVQMTTFTEQSKYFSGDLAQIAIFFRPLIRSDFKAKNKTLNTIQRLNLKKIKFNPIGDIVYRSKMLKDK